MRRLVVLTALCLLFAVRASAHGPIPAASAVLGLDGADVTLVGLTRGLAQRHEDGFLFVCPETWGGDVTAPSAGIPEGPAVVAADKLFVIASDGRVSPHPKQVGAGIALASNHNALFGLFQRDGQHELRRITDTTSDLVRGLDEPFAALAVSDSALSLLSWDEQALVLQTISLAGELGERVTFRAPSAVAYAELRRAADQLYVLIWGSAAPWVSLGRMTEHGYEALAEAGSNIAGPLALDTFTVVARDGALEPLEEEAARVGRSDYVTCLGSYLGLPYACARGGLMRIDQDGLGAPLFELASLRAPNYLGLPEAARLDCTARWLDLQEHLASATRSNVAPDASAPEAAAADAVAPDAGSRDGAPETRVQNPGGCALGTRSTQTWWPSAIFLLVLSTRRR